MGEKLTSIVTFGCRIYSYHATFKDKCVKFNVVDTSAQEKLRSIAYAHVKYAQFVLFVFGLTDRESLFGLEPIINEANNEADPHYTRILLGNEAEKADRKVSPEEVEQFAEKFNLKYVEVSHITGQNLEELFKGFAEKVITEQ